MFRNGRTQTVIVLLLFLVACAGQEKKATSGQPAEQPMTLGNSVSKVKNEATGTATQPLSDLNLVHAKVPPVLAEAQRGPYATPADQSCEALDTEVRELDAVLGADLDTPPTHSNPSLLERGGAIVTEAAAGAVKSAVQVAVPYRNWIRKLSGAEKYSKEVAAAIAAGGVRRAFLKGFRQARGCPVATAGR